MNIRNYNIFFHTHTISGIVICALLYVIFFTGSFSFFKQEITAWQKNTSYIAHSPDDADYDELLDSIGRDYNLQGRDLSFFIYRSGAGAYIDISASNDSVLNKTNLAKMKPAKGEKKGRRRGARGDGKYFSYDFVEKKTGDYATNYDMGEFLYRLHFLAQLNEVPIRV